MMQPNQPQQPQAPAPQAEAKDPQVVIEGVHEGLGQLLELVKAEAPEQSQKLEAMIGQFEGLIAEIAQGGGPKQPGGEPGQVAAQGGASGVPMSPEV